MKKVLYGLFCILGIYVFSYTIWDVVSRFLSIFLNVLLKHFVPFISDDHSKVLLDNLENLIKIILELAAVFAAITGIRHLLDLRQKQSFATVSYLSPLRARLHSIKQYLCEYKVYIFSALDINGRKSTVASKVEFVKQLRDDFASNCEETRKFIENADEPYPAGRGWTKHLELLILVLLIFERLNQEDYYYWDSDSSDEKKQLEYQSWIDNIDQMIEMIDDRQKELEKELFPISPFNYILSLLFPKDI